MAQVPALAFDCASFPLSQVPKLGRFMANNFTLCTVDTRTPSLSIGTAKMIPSIPDLALLAAVLSGSALAGYDPALVGTWSTKTKSVSTGPVSNSSVHLYYLLTRDNRTSTIPSPIPSLNLNSQAYPTPLPSMATMRKRTTAQSQIVLRPASF